MIVRARTRYNRCLKHERTYMCAPPTNSVSNVKTVSSTRTFPRKVFQHKTLIGRGSIFPDGKSIETNFRHAGQNDRYGHDGVCCR